MQVRIVLYAADQPTAVGAARAAFTEIGRLDDVFSNYRAHSEVSRLSRHAGRHRVSDELFLVLQRATQLARQTDGAFDPTAGALTALWRAAIERQQLPLRADIDRAARDSGYEKLLLRDDEQTVQMGATTMQLDLGAIAKGYVLDRALATLRRAGVDRALVEAGGDIVTGAAPPEHQGWTVEVPHLHAAGGGSRCDLTLVDAAISTSGDHAQFIELDGRRYSHTVDPRTGLGLGHGRAVTVVARDGLTADGLATALTVVDEEQMRPLLDLYPPARAILSLADCGARR